MNPIYTLAIRVSNKMRLNCVTINYANNIKIKWSLEFKQDKFNIGTPECRPKCCSTKIKLIDYEVFYFIKEFSFKLKLYYKYNNIIQ